MLEMYCVSLIYIGNYNAHYVKFMLYFVNAIKSNYLFLTNKRKKQIWSDE